MGTQVWQSISVGQVEQNKMAYSVSFRAGYCFLCIVLLRILWSNTIFWGDLFVLLHRTWNSGRKDCYGCVAG